MAFQSGAFQSGAFQIVAVPVATQRGDDAPPRRPRVVIVYYDEPPEVERKPAKAPRRKVRRKAVEAAIEIPWAGYWTPDEALAALPRSVPVLFDPPRGMTAAEIEAVAIAMWLAQRAAEDEDDIEMLLMAAA